MSNKQYGLGYERKEKKFWEDKGHTVLRSRGSFGLFDMVVVNMNFWRMISVKATKQKYYSFKKELEELEEFGKWQIPPSTVKILVLYHKGKRKVLYEKVI
tara:strand:- start:11 stop:310 length:300 start_codon:yes stop_codon:yes gene_type:complete